MVCDDGCSFGMSPFKSLSFCQSCHLCQFCQSLFVCEFVMSVCAVLCAIFIVFRFECANDSGSERQWVV